MIDYSLKFHKTNHVDSPTQFALRAFVVVVIRDMLITLPYLVKDKPGPDKRERSHLLWKLKETVSVIFQKATFLMRKLRSTRMDRRLEP